MIERILNAIAIHAPVFRALEVEAAEARGDALVWAARSKENYRRLMCARRALHRIALGHPDAVGVADRGLEDAL